MIEHLPGRWDDLTVVCAGTSWDGIWFPEKHIADRLTAYGPVLWVDPPVSPLSPCRNPDIAASPAALLSRSLGRSGPWLRLIRPGLARLTPVVLPGMRRPGIERGTEFLVRRALRSAVESLGGTVRAVVIACPDVLFGECGEQLKVVYATDDFVAGAALMGVGATQVRRNERRLAGQADLVVGVSQPLVDHWSALGRSAVLVANGCDESLFATTDDAPLPDDVGLPGPIAGFIGHLSDRIDLDLVEAVAATGRSLLLVGPRQPTFEIGRMEGLLALPNVRWVGPKPFEALPSYMRVIDVGLTPYAGSEFNRASFPLKTLEYLAGGRGVVATDLPAVRWLDSPLITVASAPDEYGAAVDRALDEPRTPALVAERRALARRHSWSARTAEFAAAVSIGEPALAIR